MNEGCSNTQKALYTTTALTESEKTHIADCADCQALEGALKNVDTTYMVQEEAAPARFAKVMVTQVLEREGNRKKILKSTIIAGCLLVLALGLQLLLPVGAIIFTLIIAIAAVALALKFKKSRKWIALGATCCLALIVVSGGAPTLEYRRRTFPRPGSSLAYDQQSRRDSSAPDPIESMNQHVEKLKVDSLRLQKEHAENKKVKDHFESQGAGSFGNTLNRLSKTEQKLDDALNREQASTSFAGVPTLNGAAALGGAEGSVNQPSVQQPEAPLAPKRSGTSATPQRWRSLEVDKAKAVQPTERSIVSPESRNNVSDPTSIVALGDLQESQETEAILPDTSRLNEYAISFEESPVPALGKSTGHAVEAFDSIQSTTTSRAESNLYEQRKEGGKKRRQLGGKEQLKAGSEIAGTLPHKIAASSESDHKRMDARPKNELSRDSTAQIANAGADSDIASNDYPPPPSEADAEQQIVPPVTYLDPNGYWENTYLPGSPAIPLLLESLHNTIFPHVAMDEIMNTSGAFMVQHPVDPPLQGALGMAAHTDLPYLDTPSRVLLQVTIKGAERAKGNRPPLTIVVVIPDSENIPANELQVLQDTLRALEAERRVDDHIAILTDEDDVPVPFDAFRYGTLTLFLKKLHLGSSSEPLPGGIDAIFRKASTLALGDDGTQLRERIILTIGHSGTSSFEPAYPTVDSHVLQGGVASVLALADNVELMRLSARGQGSYRVLNPSLPAENQVRAELESYGAVVARALRLNVQLQPGVKLKEIIGSNKLSAPDVEREKAIEVATDQRIAQSLGIEADRGNDDPGIQILIPRFLSGDSHVVILDLLVEHAGQIADISLKSKDLVLMRNETLHASAALPSYRDDAGEINSIIAHNEYAQRLATVIRMVRNCSEEGNLSQGVALLQVFAQELENYVPASHEKSNTINLINNYSNFLEAMITSSQQGNSSGVREAVTSSLDVTSGKILGNPVRRNK